MSNEKASSLWDAGFGEGVLPAPHTIDDVRPMYHNYCKDPCHTLSCVAYRSMYDTRMIPEWIKIMSSRDFISGR